MLIPLKCIYRYWPIPILHHVVILRNYAIRSLRTSFNIIQQPSWGATKILPHSQWSGLWELEMEISGIPRNSKKNPAEISCKSDFLRFPWDFPSLVTQQFSSTLHQVTIIRGHPGASEDNPEPNLGSCLSVICSCFEHILGTRYILINNGKSPFVHHSILVDCWLMIQINHWLVVEPPRKICESQLGWLFPIYGTWKIFQTTNQNQPGVSCFSSCFFTEISQSPTPILGDVVTRSRRCSIHDGP